MDVLEEVAVLSLSIACVENRTYSFTNAKFSTAPAFVFVFVSGGSLVSG